MLKEKNKKDNFMLYIPLKNHMEWVEKDNVISLIFHHNKKIERFASWLTKKSTITDIELDEVGTKVWKLINGERTVYDIGQGLFEIYGEKCELLYERLIMYLRYLNNKRWIKFKKVD